MEEKKVEKENMGREKVEEDHLDRVGEGKSRGREDEEGSCSSCKKPWSWTLANF